jgi:galactosamine-6-phosphate isomerase
MNELQVFADYEALSRRAADWLVSRLRARPNSLLCLAAGSTPHRTYELLAQRGAADPTLVAHCRFLKLDEWGGLPIDDPANCEHQLRSVLIGPIGATDRYVGFKCTNEPAAQAKASSECTRIANWLNQVGPIDICILGLGVNGHLGFNEPASYLLPHSHVAHLSEASLAHPMLRGTTLRPAYGLTLGMADLLQSREVLLLVSGAAKRGPLERLLAGRISTDFPASLLHLHPRVTLLADAAALAERR